MIILTFDKMSVIPACMRVRVYARLNLNFKIRSCDGLF
jgi:hypothetical protein